jgi:hypothetical protein
MRLTVGLTMRLIPCFIMGLGLSACATDYVSQLSEPNFGYHTLKYSEENLDPSMLMDGTYASKQLNGFYGSRPYGAFCLTGYRCSQATQQWSGWDP